MIPTVHVDQRLLAPAFDLRMGEEVRCKQISHLLPLATNLIIRFGWEFLLIIGPLARRGIKMGEVQSFEAGPTHSGKKGDHTHCIGATYVLGLDRQTFPIL